MKKQASWLILAIVLSSNTTLNYKKDVVPPRPAVQQNVNWSESVGSVSADQDFEGTIFNGPINNTVHSVKNFLDERHLDVTSQDGRVILFYKVN